MITENGIYDLTMEDYHGQPCDGPSISSTGLRTIELKSPAHYWCTSSLNPERVAEDDKPHFAFGRAAHHLILGEKGFYDQYSIRPAIWEDYKKKAAQDWRDGTIAEGKTPLTIEELEIVSAIARSLENHPLIQAGIIEGDIEKSIIAKDPKTGVWLKARPDAIPAASNILSDLKFVADASPRAVDKSTFKYGYHMQMALAGYCYKLVTGIDIANDGYVLVFVEKKPPYPVNIKVVDPQAIWRGAQQCRRAIDRFAECLKANDWPGYEDDDRPLCVPDWMEKRMEAEESYGTLPTTDILGLEIENEYAA